MQMQLAALGMFAFTTDSTLFDKLTRSRDWRHERTERFGVCQWTPSLTS